MKKVLGYIALLLAVIMVASGCMVKFEDERLPQLEVNEIDITQFEAWKQNEDFRLVDEDAISQLYISVKTTEFALVDKTTGKVVFSNPQDRPTNDNRLNSVLRVTYYDDDDKACEYNSYLDANLKNGVADSTVTFTRNENGDLRAIYTLGKVIEPLLCPIVMSAETYDKYVTNSEKLSPIEKRNMNNMYKRYEWNPNGDRDVIQTAELYPCMKEFPIYVCGAKKQAQNTVATLLGKADFNFELMYAEYEKCGYEEEDKTINIRITLDYSLDNGALVVNMPADGVWINRATTKLAQIHVLEYLSAGGAEDEGSILIPDGSGALINWNNGKNISSTIKLPIYGRDKGIILEKYSDNTEKAYMPIYAQMKKVDGKVDQTTFVIIENGEELATLNAMTKSDTQLYNVVYPSFIYTNMSEQQYIRYTTKYFQKQLPSTDVTIRIKGLYGDDADYVSAAEYYREYLVESGKLTDKDLKNDNYAINVDFFGAADVKRSVLGIPVTVWLKLTGYGEAKEILADMKSNGVDNINVCYTAWANGGYRHNIFDHVSTIGSLGSENDLKDLFSYAEQNGINIYPDADIQYASEDYDELFDSFISFMHATRTLANEAGLDYEYSMSIREPKKIGNFYMIRHERYADIMNGFLNGYEKFNNKRISLNGLTSDIYSDFNQMYGVTRDQALDAALDTMKIAADKGYSILANGTNFAALQYASAIRNAPVSSSGYYLADESIPFYNIVLHGYVQYYTIPINTADDYMVLFLRALETGSGLSFKLIKAPNEIIKDINYGIFYSMNYDLWSETVYELYDKANKDLAHIQDCTIIDHANLADDVAYTKYSDGTVVYVNYSNEDYVADGITIPSMDYIVEKGGVR